ncbi:MULTISPECIES: hemolysin family protein [Fusobacterium]|jgi:CBS domain containing-hemolysin-like protein|uniref:Polyamine export protein n=1 Tax=Fusobacterium hominis TaxID=2764326 RepID=A0A7G9GY40_9FUSO|nr:MULTISPECIES: hemolysin family protein [Fusobacterium]QNM15722.1 HlyC/CorC family transporter [Fusobacterium hominis]
MSFLLKLLSIVILIGISMFLSISEISLASARKIKLQIMDAEGNKNAAKVMDVQENSGDFFTAVQIGINAVSILGGIIGNNIVGDYVVDFIQEFFPSVSTNAVFIGNLTSFILITALFIEFADLIPKRLAMIAPEKIAVSVVVPMLLLIKCVKPLIFIFNGIANFIFKIFNVPLTREESITYDDIFAMVDAGAEAGVVQKKEHSLIENIFELESRWVSSIMTTRDNIVYLTISEGEESIRKKIAEQPHSKFLVCETDIDSILGYVSSKNILPRILKGELNSLSDIKDIYNRSLLVIPNTLTLSEALDRFNEVRDDFAIVLNEYGLVVGLVTLNDVVNTLMGDIVYQEEDDQIISRGEGSWLIDGSTPIEDVKKVLHDVEKLPEEDTYETIAGFMMYMLKTIPKKGAKVEYQNYSFEVVDVDRYKIDQLLVTRKVNIVNTNTESHHI